MTEDLASDVEAIWRPQKGPQKALFDCPVPEILYGGARGGGKTDGCLGKMAFLGEKYGESFNCVFFRREAAGFDDVIQRSANILEPLGWVYNAQRLSWMNQYRARIRFRPLDRVRDAEKYQGQNITHAIIEEAGQYADPAPIDRLWGAIRSPHGIPTQMIMTANPGGPGQLWLRERFIDAAPGGFTILRQNLPSGGQHRRIYIPARLEHNRLLNKFDPQYVNRLYLVGNPKLVQAWLEGDWQSIEGAFFDEWDSSKHVVRPFRVPDHWARFRAIDWGSARPFCVGWYAVASETYHHKDGHQIPRGAIVKYREWYGKAKGQANVGLKLTAEEVGAGIAQRERHDPEIRYGVADPAMFAEDGGPSIAERIFRGSGQNVRLRPGDNTRVGQRGRMGGWDQLRHRLRGEDEVPWLYFFSTCEDSIRTIPVLQHDTHKPEDLDTEAEDHAADETRYACMSRPITAPSPKAKRPQPTTRQPTLNEALRQDDKIRDEDEPKI